LAEEPGKPQPAMAHVVPVILPGHARLRRPGPKSV
jgi:hypothetical protein